MLRQQKRTSLHMRNGVMTSLPSFFAFSCSIDSATSFPTRLVLGEQESSSSEGFHIRWLPRCGRLYRRHLPLYSHTRHGVPCCMFMLPYFKWCNSPLLLQPPIARRAALSHQTGRLMAKEKEKRRTVPLAVKLLSSLGRCAMLV